MKPGPENLITDVDGFLVGNATDTRIKTGTTVFTAKDPFTAAVHIMGGAPGTRDTELLSPERLVQQVNALVLSGGSAFGLDAASGVTDAMAAQGVGFQVGNARVPIVPGAIVFDLMNGGNKDWTENPYKVLGAEALANAAASFDLGTEGAGTGATTAQHKGGLGSSSLVLPSGITVGALVVVNAVGSVTDKAGRFYAAPFEMGGEFGDLGLAAPETLSETFTSKLSPPDVPANTTIAVIATDADLTQAQAQRVAIAAHDGMARAILPAHTPFDGDLVFTASSGAKPMAGGDMDLPEIGHAASLCLSRAIARGVWEATPAEGDLFPCLHG
ncbi:MAG: P1 family peptidase [Rhodobacteraceae bacterium]|nr:P1 family peptidase [Paracoccaceae bacterium]